VKRSTVAMLLLLGAWTTMTGAQPRMLNVGDAAIRCEATGRGQALVFIHGWAHTLEIWDDQVVSFSPRYRVIRFDRRGFGQSTGHADVSEVRWEQTQEVRAPMLIVHGDHEIPINIAFADSLMRRMPNARRVVITDGGHGAHVAQPEQFNAALLQFFARVERSPQ